MLKRRLNFYVNGTKQSIKAALDVGGKLIGPGKWKTYHFHSKNTSFTTYDENDEIVDCHVFNSYGKEITEETPKVSENSENVERKYNELGKVIYEKNTVSGDETWHEYDGTGFEYHRKFSSGYEHFFTPDENGLVSGIMIKNPSGEVIMNSTEFWSDDRRYKIRKTESFDTGETQLFIHEYFYDKKGVLVKTRLYTASYGNVSPKI